MDNDIKQGSVISGRRPVLVLDLDGTLVDSKQDLAATINAVIAAIGIGPVPVDTIGDKVGKGAKAMIQQAFAYHRKTLEPELLEQLFQQFLAYYRDHIADHSLPYPGILDALALFDREGWLLAVCTNKYEDMAKSLLRALDMDKQFAAICGSDTFTMRKPDGRHILQTIAKAGGDPALSIMVGDTATDIDAALDAGIFSVAVDFGYSEIPVSQLGANRIISHYDELWPIAREYIN